jgi:hypothetical protein
MAHDSIAFDLEGALDRSFSTAMPGERRAVVDRRISKAVGTTPYRHRGASRLSRGGIWRHHSLRRMALIGVAVLILGAGTVAAAGGLFDRLTANAPLLTDVWARSTVVHQVATDAGYAITLERAAVDPDRIWVALSVATKTGANGSPDQMELTDGNGAVYTGGIGALGEVKGQSATIFGFKVPAGTKPMGPYILKVTNLSLASGEQPGSWTFKFDVPPSAASPMPQ